jgi:excinuclease ABC subunit B
MHKISFFVNKYLYYRGMQKNLQDFLQLDPSALPDQVPWFMEHMLQKMDDTIANWMRVLLLAITKRSSEEITNFLLSHGYKAYYLHSEVDTIDRWDIIQKLKKGEIDILVWVNLLREGIDLPEVWFIAVLDADKEWFLRSTTALVQNIWRAARNPDSEVVLYADKFTWSMMRSLHETYRRRHIQHQHNLKNNITPTRAESNVKDLDVVRTDEELAKMKEYQLIKKWKVKRLKRMTKKEKEIIAADLRWQLEDAIKERRFEEAAVIRDQLKELEEG